MSIKIIKSINSLIFYTYTFVYMSKRRGEKHCYFHILLTRNREMDI